ncbi:MAG: DUF6015 family protein [Candidatus Aenigmatarchaeota archaeon]
MAAIEGPDCFDGVIKFVHARVKDWPTRFTPKVFSDALMYTIGMKKVDREGADKLAHYIIDMLTEDGTILDNSLEPEERSTFHDLEDAGLMGTQRYETALMNGRYWRVHQWYPRIDNILKYAKAYNEARKPTKTAKDMTNIEYVASLDEIWQKHAESETVA